MAAIWYDRLIGCQRCDRCTCRSVPALPRHVAGRQAGSDGQQAACLLLLKRRMRTGSQAPWLAHPPHQAGALRHGLGTTETVLLHQDRQVRVDQPPHALDGFLSTTRAGRSGQGPGSCRRAPPPRQAGWLRTLLMSLRLPVMITFLSPGTLQQHCTCRTDGQRLPWLRPWDNTGLSHALLSAAHTQSQGAGHHEPASPHMHEHPMNASKPGTGPRHGTV